MEFRRRNSHESGRTPDSLLKCPVPHCLPANRFETVAIDPGFQY